METHREVRNDGICREGHKAWHCVHKAFATDSVFSWSLIQYDTTHNTMMQRNDGRAAVFSPWPLV